MASSHIHGFKFPSPTLPNGQAGFLKISFYTIPPRLFAPLLVQKALLWRREVLG
jgi:hypothetical protein